MKIRTRLTQTLLMSFITAAFVAGTGCGKDKPESDEASEGAKHESGDDKAESDATSEKKGDDANAEKKEADASEHRPKRPGRDKVSRRPPPVKHVEADVKHAEGDVSAVPPDTAIAQPGPAAAPPPVVGGMPAPELAAQPPTGGPGPNEASAPLNAPPLPAAAPTMPEPQPAPQGGRDAETLLPLSIVYEQLGALKLSSVGALPGIAVRPGYSSVLYARPDATKFGIALQVWEDTARNESDDRYRRMRMQYPHAEEVNVVAPAKAFFAQFRGIQSLTFVDAVTRTVVSVSCGEGLCTHEQLTKLAKAVRARF